MMANEFKVGELYTTIFTVTDDMTINRSGKPNAEVLSTPSLLNLMELCTIEASDQYLNDQYTTVGYAVDKMRHLAPTLPGRTVKISATLTNVDGNKLTYSIEAAEADKNIGFAIHKRAIIEIVTVFIFNKRINILCNVLWCCIIL
mgnify:CR=1 FL=1